MRILGIDPGSSRIGFGVIKKEGSKLSLITTGVIEIPKGVAAEKLNALAVEFKKLLTESKPHAIGIEKLFFSKNVKTGIEVAQARGLLLHLASATAPVYEFTPQQVKVATTNYGGADKKAVARMVAMILAVPPLRILDDATDALAIAIATAGTHRPVKAS
ncbi:MAG: crossover junction endodeoxyribonuclease RuvC [Candidatus Pacebacteria bacterium]|nr:crossover junction endodeoxyribonuclease RuvC [Candidatus Paceibacterota bacterium]